MDEDKLIEELRAQRKLIQKHLEWLDQKIAAPDGDDSESEESGKSDSQESKETKPKELPAAQSTDQADKESADDDDEQLISKYKAPSGNDLQRAKIGCLVLFVLSTTLFLFLLFGLPYLLD